MNITREYLTERLRYEPESGRFYWLQKSGTDHLTRLWNAKFSGSVAGRKNQEGYIQIFLNDRRYCSHKLVWLYFTGEWPTGEIDHINGNRSDDRFCNLRPAAAYENAQNKGRYSNNTSGFRGVSWNKSASKWCAVISVNGEKVYLGIFSDPSQAHSAYLRARQKRYLFQPTPRRS